MQRVVGPRHAMRYAARMKRDAAVEQVGRYFTRNGEDVACAWLFGSVARNAAAAGSDVDVAVLFRTAPPATLAGSGVRLEAELERVLGCAVDLVVLNRAPVDLAHRVLRDGVLVFEADASARVRFEVRARNEWFDLEPYLNEYRRISAKPDGRR